MQIRPFHVLYLTLVAAASGCSQGPARVAAPNVDVEAAVNRAIALYDSNGDGALSEDELVTCPGIVGRWSAYDTNDDKLVSRDEMAVRLGELFGNRVGLTQLISRVTYQGKPLSEAIVVFEPESYLGSGIKAAEGVTDKKGAANMSIAAEHLPENLRNRQFIQCGTYKVRITHPQINLPAKYNTETTLGYETQLGNPFAAFALTAK